MTERQAWAAVVLAGGRGRRLGNRDKAQMELDGRTLLDHILVALPPSVEVVVVGPAMATARPVRFVLEEPRYGGPVAALAAALPMVSAANVVVLATDMPAAGVLAEALALQLDATGSDVVDAVVPLDAEGKRQSLCAAYRRDALTRALASEGGGDGVPMRTLLAQLRIAEWRMDAADTSQLADIDTLDDWQRAQDARRTQR